MKDEEAALRLNALKEGRTWEQVAEFLSRRLGESINRGTVYKVARGETESIIVRRALGLPLRHVTVAPCQCGQVHARKCKQGKAEERRARSAAPSFLAFIQTKALPFLEGRKNGKEV